MGSRLPAGPTRGGRHWWQDYLAAYAQHLGATGLTFFDDDVISFFSPHARDKSAIFLLAIGKPLKRNHSRANSRIVGKPSLTRLGKSCP